MTAITANRKPKHSFLLAAFWSLSVLIVSTLGAAAATSTVSNTNDSGADNLSPTACVGQPPNLVSWYKGEGNTLDSKGTNNGTIQGDVTYTTGKVGQTFTLGGNGDLAGNGDRVIVGNPANLRLQNFTIEAWIKRSSSTIVTNSPFPGFDDGVFFAYGLNGYGFFIEQATNRLGLTLIGTSSVTSTATISDTNFHHVAVTKSGNQVTFYVDGVAAPPVTYNVTFTFTTDAAIGARGDDNAENAFFGSIDELSIYNRALSLAEIQGIFNAGSGGKCDSSTLQNISTRLQVLTGDQVPIGGFIVTGTDPKMVLLRAIGPSLSDFGITNALADPVLELHAADGTLITTNDNWTSQRGAIEDTKLQPSNDLESAIVATLEPGSYTAIMTGKNGGTGIGLVEAYDLDQGAASEMANISTRGFVETGDNVMIGGFILGSNSTVLVRAIGPSLTNFGVAGALANPMLELRDAQGTLVESNDDWTSSAQMIEIEQTMLAPSKMVESAILETLPAGAYTAIVSGKSGGTGVGLVEVYRLP
ncbi:MAG: LamG domain-containing protein [Chthoniobacterales bacterium]